MPSLDLVIGLYYLCGYKPEAKGPLVFSSAAEGSWRWTPG